MFQKNLTIYLQRTKVIVIGQKGKNKKPLAYKYDGGDLGPIFATIKKKFKPDTVRIILGEGDSYVLTLKLPSEKPQEQEIFMEARSLVPETLSNDNYDYRKIGHLKEDTLVQVFAMPVEIHRHISRAALQKKLNVEVIMSVTILLADETREVDKPHLIIWKEQEHLVLLAHKGSVYISEKVTGTLKDHIDSVLKYAKDEFSTSVKNVITNYDLGKAVKFPKSWKVQKKSLNPEKTIKKYTKQNREKENVLAAVTSQDAAKLKEKKQSRTQQEQDYDLSAYDQSEISAPHITGVGEGSLDMEEPNTESKTSKKKIVIIALLIIIIVGTLAGGVLFATRQGQEQNEPVAEQLEEELAEGNEVDEEQPEQPEATSSGEASLQVNLEDYSVEVQNGAGVAGIATEIAEQLEEEGFVEVETANADNFEYFEMTIFKKESVEDEVVDVINSIFEDQYEVSLSDEELEAEGEFDVVVIVGAI